MPKYQFSVLEAEFFLSDHLCYLKFTLRKSEALHPTETLRTGLRRPCSGKWAVALSRKHDEEKCHSLIPFGKASTWCFQTNIRISHCQSLAWRDVQIPAPLIQDLGLLGSWGDDPIFPKTHQDIYWKAHEKSRRSKFLRQSSDLYSP